jgi:carboxymethylenebutenolidase
LSYSEADLEGAAALRSRLDIDQAVLDVDDTVQALRGLVAHSGKVGVLGYSMGGLLAYLAAARLELDCAVSYYGVGIEQYLAEMAHIRCPALLHVGEADAKVPAGAQQAIQARRCCMAPSPATSTPVAAMPLSIRRALPTTTPPA